MRITTNLIYNQSMHSMTKASERNLKMQEKIGEQSDIIRPSDDPNGTGQVLLYDVDTKQLEQYEENMTQATNALQYESIALESLNDVMDEITQRLIQAKNGTYSQDDLDSIADDISGLVVQTADLMNSRNSNNQYIFAGTNSKSPAFERDASGKYVYAGNEMQQNAQIASTITIPTNDSGKKVFQDVWTRNDFSASVSAGPATLEYRVSDQAAYDAFSDSNFSAITPVLNDYTLTTIAGAPDQFEFRDSGGTLLASGDYISGEPIVVSGMEFTVSGAAGSTVSMTLGTPTRDNVLNQVMTAVSALKDTTITPLQREQAMLDASTSIKNTQASMAKASSAVGARLNTIDSRTDYSANKKIYNAIAQENIAGLNIFEATTELELSDAALSASQLLFTRISGLSLFNSL